MTEKLPPDELRVLEILRPLGLDWKTTREQFAARFGKSSYYNWREVIKLPASSAISKSPLEFQIHAEDRFALLPPEYLWADYYIDADSRANFAGIEPQLRKTLGEGMRAVIAGIV